MTSYSKGQIDWEANPKWVRVQFGDTFIADSKRTMLLLEKNHLPVYYFPKEDVRMDLLAQTNRNSHCPHKGNAVYWTVRVGDQQAENAVWGYPQPNADAPPLADYVAFYWQKMDHWFEEDEEVYGHAKDPYHRIDVLTSSRHVRVEIDGETVAETQRPRLLFETGLPVRYYIPRLDVRADLLVPSDKTTLCAYKGIASYYSIALGDTTIPDVVWTYRFPNYEYAKIQDRLCFFNEKVDLYVDGDLEIRPHTMWS